MNLARIWNTALGTMQVQMPRQEFTTWLRTANLLSVENSTATIGVPHAFIKEGLENRYTGMLRNVLTEMVGFPVHIRVVIAPNQLQRPESRLIRDGSDSGMTPEPVEAAPMLANFTAPRVNGHSAQGLFQQTERHQMQQLDLSSAMRSGMLNPRYTFDRFIIGSSNRLASAACMAVAENPAQEYNPLFIYGGVGLGKTHLLHAIGNYALDRDPEVSVMYITSEKFTNDLINAIRRQQTDEFRIRYRNIDILLIDDIQFIAGKESTQEEFFHTFNALHSAGKQIVISSDRPPKAIMTLEERLRSRFEWGLIVDVQMPDLETRTAILRAKAEQMAMPISEQVLDFLAHRVQSHIRELEGCLNRVVAYAQLHGTGVSVETATAALSELLDTTRKKRITPETIMHQVAEYYGVDVKAMQGRSRSRNVVVPRQVAMYLLREETDSSLMEIGRLLGGRDHTTVMYGCEKMNEELSTDARLRQEIMTIREKLHARN